MTIIEAVVGLIKAASIVELSGSVNKVFQYEMPHATDIGVLVIPVLESFLTREDTPGYFTGEFLVVVRHNSIEKAINLSKLVASSIDLYGVSTADYNIRRVRPLNLPFPFPRSVGDKYEVMIQSAIAFSEK